MTQEELNRIRTNINSLMDQTMALHEESAALRCSEAQSDALWKPVVFALTVMSIGAAWSAGCVLLFRALS